jgi:hypothetical protein
MKIYNFFIYRILALVRLDQLWILFFSKDSFLWQTGWFKSTFSKKSVGKLNEKLPWFTYPMIKFLEKKLEKNFSVLEFGGGNSTLWFSPRVGHIHTVENESSWFTYMKNNSPENALLELIQVKSELNYSELAFLPLNNPTPYSFGGGDSIFDIIIIDGIDRNNCIVNSYKKLSENGIFIIDNTDTNYEIKLKQGFEFLQNKDFKRLDFWGMCPIVARISCTSIFYRSNNLFNI